MEAFRVLNIILSFSFVVLSSTAQAHTFFNFLNHFRSSQEATTSNSDDSKNDRLEIQKLRLRAREIRLNFGTPHLIIIGDEKSWYQPLRQNQSEWLVQLSTKVKVKGDISIHLVQAEHLETRNIIRIASLMTTEEVLPKDLELVKNALLESNHKSELLHSPSLDQISKWTLGSTTCKKAIK